MPFRLKSALHHVSNFDYETVKIHRRHLPSTVTAPLYI